MKSILFDLDGTLCDTLPDITNSINRVLTARGYAPHSREAVSAMVGHSAAYMVKAAAPQASEEELAEILAAYFADYALHLADDTRPYAGMTETLQALAVRGHKLAIVTNKPHTHAVRLVQAIFPPHGNIFTQVQGQTHKFPTKPRPESLYFVMQTLNISAEDAVYIGDSEVDAAFAKNAGIPFVGCAWGFRGRDVLLAAGAEVIIDRPEELLTVL